MGLHHHLLDNTPFVGEFWDGYGFQRTDSLLFYSQQRNLGPRTSSNSGLEPWANSYRRLCAVFQKSPKNHLDKTKLCFPVPPCPGSLPLGPGGCSCQTAGRFWGQVTTWGRGVVFRLSDSRPRHLGVPWVGAGSGQSPTALMELLKSDQPAISGSLLMRAPLNAAF